MSLQNTSYALKTKFGNQIRKLIMIVIADYSNDAGEAWPSVDTLANRAECSRRSVQEHLNVLVSEGHLKIQLNAGPRGCNLYQIIFKNSPSEIPFGNPVKQGGANPAPAQNTAQGAQTGDAHLHGGGANGRRSFAPEPLGTVKEPSGEREGRSLAAASPQDLQIIAAVNSLRPAWQIMPALSAKEAAAFAQNRPALASIPPAGWETLKQYLNARQDPTPGAYRPKSREKLLSDIGDVLSHAAEWQDRRPKKKKPKPKHSTHTDPADPGLSPAEIAEFFKQNPLKSIA